MPHFTYKPTRDLTQLHQGDILEKTEEIKSILKEVHPHYLKPDYLYFIVLTQSCDLVPRFGEGKCTSPYITLAAVRPFGLLISREVSKHQKHPLQKKADLLDGKSRGKAFQFLERLLNNNEYEYFYLNEDVTLGFPESCVAFLRLSISIKSEEHYLKCLHAKKLELDDVFRSKLGWLVGHMYSRIGTKDWVSNDSEKIEFDKKLDEILSLNFMWVEDWQRIARQLRKKFDEETLKKMSKTEIQQAVKDIKIPSKKEDFLLRFDEILKESKLIAAPQDIPKIVNLVRNDTALSGLF